MSWGAKTGLFGLILYDPAEKVNCYIQGCIAASCHNVDCFIHLFTYRSRLALSVNFKVNFYGISVSGN